VPELVKAGATLSCILVTRLVSGSPRGLDLTFGSLRHNMTPHATPILSTLAYQLEQDISAYVSEIFVELR